MPTRVSSRVDGLILRRSSDNEPLSLEAAGIRVVGRSPELDPQTGTVNGDLEVPLSAAELRSAARSKPRSPGRRAPRSSSREPRSWTTAARPSCYVQVEGESFARREVRVGAAGRRALVDGLRAGERLVTQGGAAIRRASLLSTGAPEGHVH